METKILKSVDGIEQLRKEFEINNYIFRGESKKYNSPCRASISNFKSLETNEWENYKEIFDYLHEKQVVSWIESEKPQGMWLSCLQHYEFPTRFVDWTVYFDVALYYACKNYYKNNGYIYVLNRDFLIKKFLTSSISSKPLQVKEYWEREFFLFPNLYENLMGCRDDIVLPVKPIRSNPREEVNGGCFTVSTNFSENFIDMCNRIDKDLLKIIIINRSSKESINICLNEKFANIN